ncbi:G2/mitotic-specific cyclin-2-like isoform X3 [Nicotiana tomentosiformis]|uniref:G2/mitotic-specific cyclin-2-like isoform X3 n=1 Tax=Nicotiana tomentosiformis TaxID=4098 RepID=UPI00051ACA76|nr:G2/mitotic-specific cyclin-2-like isoform X6 [Nicotiana tomentosiformis]
MVGSDENCQGVIMASNVQGAGGGKVTMGHNRRALSTINGNIVEAPAYPCKVHKRNGITDKSANGVKNPPIPIHRPVTRKFAAQMATKLQQPTVEVTKQPVQTATDRNESEDRIIIDVEDYKATSDYDPVPMFVQHTEAMMEEIDRMDAETEMEDVEETLIVDIDSADKKNPLAVVEYIDDMHAYYKKTESSSCAPPNYMEQQFDINERMRAILIDWLIEVHYKFDLMEETLYLTVNLIDRFLAVQQVIRKKLQLVGVTAMLLACKYEEVSVPVVEDLILISDKAYTRKEVLEMEKLMINTLQFNLSVPTTYVFMMRFLKAAQSDKKVELLSFFMTELCLVEYEMLRFPPSMLAAAAIFTAQCALSAPNELSKTCEKYSHYTQDQLLECSRLMVSFHQKAAIGKLTGVYRKYSISKYGFVAKCPPASFLLEACF